MMNKWMMRFLVNVITCDLILMLFPYSLQTRPRKEFRLIETYDSVDSELTGISLWVS
jgi:hypothetical protein